MNGAFFTPDGRVTDDRPLRGEISENRFARADLEHILLCVDDDMQKVEACWNTGKSIIEE